MRKSATNKKSRLNIRVREELLSWVKRFAKKKHTSVSQLINDHFVRLQEENHG